MNESLVKFKTYASLLMVACAFGELVVFFSFENIFAICSLIGGWLLISTVLTHRNLHQYPVSFLMILGLAVFMYLLPMPLTLIEFKPVTFNLRVPYLTFFHHFLFAAAIVTTHRLYTTVSCGNNIFRWVLNRTSFYVEPTNKVIWVTALLGLLASFYNYFVVGTWQMETLDRGPVYYVTTILSGYIWMPLIMLFPKLRQIQTGDIGKTFKYVAIYSSAVLLIAIVSNWRTILFSGIFIVIGLFGFSLLLQHYKLREVVTPKRFGLCVLAILAFTGPLLDLAQAMVIVRGERTELSAADFFSRTVDVYNSKSELEIERKSYLNAVNNINFEWNEVYLGNIVLNRMVNLKISDNCLYYAEVIGYQNSQMQDELANQIIALMPNVVLSMFDISAQEKINMSDHSIGDYLYGVAISSREGFGSAAISSIPGVGMSIFGYWYLLVIVPLFALTFAMFDSFVKIKNGRIIYSYLFFFMFTLILNYFNDRHVFVNDFKFILRSYFESVVIFLITMKVIRFFSLEKSSVINRKYTGRI